MCEFCKAEVNERNAVINGSRDKMSLDKDNELEIVVNVNPRVLYDYFFHTILPNVRKEFGINGNFNVDRNIFISKLSNCGNAGIN